jgi:hypothetical protein
MQRRDFIRLAICAATIGPLAEPVFAEKKTRKLLLIHGRGQQNLDSNQLKKNWINALTRGLAAKGKALSPDVDVAFPYYGDVLDHFTTAANIPLTSEVQARGSQDDDFLRFQADVAEELRTRAGITNAQIDAEYGNDPEPHGPLNWKWVQAILRAIDKNGHGMNQRAIEVFTRDVYLYSTRSGVRDAIDAIVTKKLSEEPTVVVGHSLGTVVAYSILTRDTRPIKVPLLVTVGSPLGVRAVRDQFIPVHSPPSVKSWYNAYDPRDVVALYPLDQSSFPVTPPIDNFGKVKNHTDNRHGIDGYLDDPDVAGKIASQLA